jgi:hypothetical protein
MSRNWSTMTSGKRSAVAGMPSWSSRITPMIGSAASRSRPSASTLTTGITVLGMPGRSSRSRRSSTDDVAALRPDENHVQVMIPVKRNSG